MRRAGVVGTTHTPWSVGTGGVASSGRRAPRRPAPAKPPRPSGSGRWTRLADPRFRYPLAVAARAAARCVAGPAVRLPGYGGGRRARPVRVGVQVPGGPPLDGQVVLDAKLVQHPRHDVSDEVVAGLRMVVERQ